MSVRISASRACDACRRSKRKCAPASRADGANATLGAIACALCESTGTECTYVMENRPRAPSKAYVQRLESHVQELEAEVRTLNRASAPLTPQADSYSRAVSDASPAHSGLAPSKRPCGRAVPTGSSSRASPIAPIQDFGASDGIRLAMARLDVTDFPFRYHGSSSLHHIYLAIDEIRGFKDAEFLTRVKASMRREFWVSPAWDVTSSAPLDIRPFATWPEPALERRLVDAYFARLDIHLPLLDADTFRRKLAAGSALRDLRFSAVCWLVFANASRMIDEPATQYSRDPRSSGWAYFLAAKEAIADADRSRPHWLPEMPDEISLQVAVLTCTWLHGTVSPHLSWLIAGAALRASQELGAHVRDHSATTTASSSLSMAGDAHGDAHVIALKRAFWCLYHLDIMHCVSGGRRPVFREGDFDFDPPRALFADKASSAFAQKVLLDRIVAQALDKLYGVKAGSMEDIELLLAATDHWLFALPSFLQLPTHKPSALFGDEYRSIDIDNASLCIYYHYVRLLIRRPLLPRYGISLTSHRDALTRCLVECFAITSILDRLDHCDIQAAITSELIDPICTAFCILQLGMEASTDHTGTPPLDNQAGEGTRGIEPGKIVLQMDTCVRAMSSIERHWRYTGKLTDWFSESMRTLLDRFNYAFDARLRAKWTKSHPPAARSASHQPGGPSLGELYSSEDDLGDPEKSNAEYDMLFAELFGVMPWLQT